MANKKQPLPAHEKTFLEKLGDQASHVKEELVAGKDHLVEIAGGAFDSVKTSIQEFKEKRARSKKPVRQTKKAAKKPASRSSGPAPKKAIRSAAKKPVKKITKAAPTKKSVRKKPVRPVKKKIIKTKKKK